MECLKTFVQQPAISETSKRIALLQDVNHYMASKSDLPDSVVCATLAALIKTLGNYLDTKSRKECECLLRILLGKYSSISVNFLLKNLEAFAKPLATCKFVCRSLAGKSLCALSWCNIIAETCCLVPGDSVEWSRIVRLQSFLYFGIQTSCYKQMWNSAKRKLYSLWKKMPDAFLVYSNTLLHEQESTTSCVLLTVLVTYDRSAFLLKKEEILNFFVKAIMMGKVSLPPPILHCFAPIIQAVSHNEYEKVIHPALQKGLLRNPENVFPTMKMIYGNVSIDLSRHVMDVIKMLIPQLLSKVDGSRRDAVVTAAIIAKQCSDTSAIGEVTTHLFQVLKGSQGKLTTTTQKSAILEAIGGFSEGAFGDGQSASDLAASISMQFIPFLQLENHEGSLICAVTALGCWCKKIKTHVPKEVVDCFLKMTTLKSLTHAVRVAYIACFTLTFKSDTLSQVDPFIPFLLKCVEKATQQNPQTLVIHEALCASEILVKVESVELKQNYNMANFWSTILNSKSVILSTKFIHNCSEDALMRLQQLIGYIFVYHQQKIHHDITKQFIHCMIYMLLHKSWILRRETAKTIKKIYQNFPDMSFCKEMLEEFFSVLRPSHVIYGFDGNEDDEKKLYIQPKVFLNALLCLTNIPILKEDSELAADMAMFIMKDCFHPCISELNNHVWTDYLYCHGLDAYTYIKDYRTLITENLIKLKVHSKVCLKALAELIRIAPDLILPEVREYALDVFQIKEFKTVSSTDVKIMETPDGELWNESIVKNIPQITQNKNVKRENKAYSYKEQKEAEDLQRELDLKRKDKDGRSFENQKNKISYLITNKNLSKKQIQLIEEEATKEKNIRTKLSILMEQFTEAQKILQISMEVVEKYPEMSQHLVPLIKPIVSLFCSELVSSHAQSLYVIMSRSMMYGNRNLGLQIAFVTIRMSYPVTTDSLSNEPLPKVVSKILMSLCSQNDSYSTESFAFIFPFVNAALQNHNKFMNNDPKLMCNALQMILTHVRLRQAQKKSHLPELLPFLDILKCMCQLLGATTMVQVQQTSSQVLLATCSCISQFVSGLELQKCSELLLFNLMSSATNVRTASMKIVQLFSPSFISHPCKNILIVLVKLMKQNAFEWIMVCGPVSYQFFVVIQTGPEITLRNRKIEIMFLSCMIPFGTVSSIQPDLTRKWIAIFLKINFRPGLLELEHVLNNNDLQLSRRLWVAMHEDEENISDLAKELWDNMGLHLDGIICMDLLNDVQHHVPEIQQASAGALSAALKENDSYISTILSQLFELYVTNLERPPPVLDELGRLISESPPDQFQNRIGLAFALKKISPLLDEDQVQKLFSFYVPDAIGDRNSEVRSEMLKSALEAVNDHGKTSASGLLSVLEDFLRNAPTSESYDVIRQNVVILLGTLAQHLNNDDPKIKPIVAKLTETLSTPSQAVQEAVANCLPPLVPAIKQQAPDIVQKLLAILLDSDNYGERKGAAYGLAGMVKGLGIISFKQHDIMGKLTEAIQEKKNYRHREGALMAFEMFCGMLGRLFEPYVVHVLPHLLICFGDGNQYVREAADNTARAVMRNLSAHGVRLILPSLLNALNEDTWRTKTGSAELLGAMAFCAPKQLSSCLPSIVPKLCEVLTDSHPKVQHAGQQALKQIGSVIRNPEIQAISNILLAALSDPSKKTTECLQTLLNTKFVHFIDAPSLALILPVVERAFQDRSMDTRKMAAQIIGNMYSLTNQKDLNPYLPAVIPGLKNTLLDPVPEVRAIAAKALGAMVKETGETQFKELLPWLMENLVSEMSSVDRSGAAQGLSEVLAALGTSQLTKLMPEVIRTADEDNIMPHIREGYILLFVYLPCTFGDDFIPYIGDVIPPILKALADENEFVRATALCAGQRIITMYSDTAIPFLLPQLERGLFDDNWRIRLSSIQLLGDLLYQIIGVTGKMSAHGEDDDNFGTAEGFKSLVLTLGQERRDLVLSGLYMGRSDVALRVRQSSLHVWKIIVPNTPRVLREILPTLFKLLLGCLASSIYDKRQVAAKTLGDIVRKLGERMLPELIPILERGLHSEDPSQREGVCIGLTEIIQSCSRDAIIVFTDNLVPTVRKALCDPLDGVRSAAAHTFEHLHNTIGVQALDEILPSLLHSLNNEETSTFAVDGLRQIISVKGRVVLPFIIPKLIEPPVNTEVLAVLSSVAGEALTKHLPILLRAILTALKDSLNDPSQFEIVMRDCAVVITSVEGEQGTRAIIDDLLAGLKNDDKDHRYACIILLRTLCMNKEAEYSDYVSLFMQSFIKLLADSEDNIKTVAWDALAAVTSTLDPAEMQRHVSSVRSAIRFVKSDDVVLSTGTLPGFCIPKKGLSPVLPIFREGILNGSPDLKEQSVRGLSECIVLLTPAALKPSVVQITGPLIRILGDRFSSNIRIAFLETLSLLLQKVGMYLKPFLPQLQTTFTKALQDVNREIRIQAGTALGYLTTIHPRADPLFADLNNNINNAEETSFKETMLQALRNCINLGGKKISPNMKVQLSSTLVPLLSSDEETVCRCAAGCLGNLCMYLEEANMAELVTKQMLVVDDVSASWCLRQSRSALLSVALKEAYNTIYVQQWKSKILEKVLAHTALDRVQVKTHGIHSAAYLLFHLVSASNLVPTEIIDSFKNCIEGTSNDVKVEACKSLSWVIQQCEDSSSASKVELNVADSPIDETTLLKLVSMIIPLTREKNTSVKSSGEFTLVALLGLRHGELLFQKTVGKLPAREASSLQDLLKQKLKKVAMTTHKSDVIDSTILQS